MVQACLSSEIVDISRLEPSWFWQVDGRIGDSDPPDAVFIITVCPVSAATENSSHRVRFCIKDWFDPEKEHRQCEKYCLRKLSPNLPESLLIL